MVQSLATAPRKTVSAKSESPATTAHIEQPKESPKRAPRINFDRPPVVYTVTALALLQIAALFASSSVKLMVFGEWMNVGDFAVLLPISFETTILVATLAAFVFRARGEREHTKYAWAVLGLFTATSAVINFLANFIHDQAMQELLGAAFSPLLPIGSLLTIHLVALIAQESQANESDLVRRVRTEAESGLLRENREFRNRRILELTAEGLSPNAISKLGVGATATIREAVARAAIQQNGVTS